MFVTLNFYDEIYLNEDELKPDIRDTVKNYVSLKPFLVKPYHISLKRVSDVDGRYVFQVRVSVEEIENLIDTGEIIPARKDLFNLLNYNRKMFNFDVDIVKGVDDVSNWWKEWTDIGKEYYYLPNNYFRIGKKYVFDIQNGSIKEGGFLEKVKFRGNILCSIGECDFSRYLVNFLSATGSSTGSSTGRSTGRSTGKDLVSSNETCTLPVVGQNIIVTGSSRLTYWKSVLGSDVICLNSFNSFKKLTVKELTDHKWVVCTTGFMEKRMYSEVRDNYVEDGFPKNFVDDSLRNFGMNSSPPYVNNIWWKNVVVDNVSVESKYMKYLQGSAVYILLRGDYDYSLFSLAEYINFIVVNGITSDRFVYDKLALSILCQRFIKFANIGKVGVKTFKLKCGEKGRGDSEKGEKEEMREKGEKGEKGENGENGENGEKGDLNFNEAYEKIMFYHQDQKSKYEQIVSIRGENCESPFIFGGDGSSGDSDNIKYLQNLGISREFVGEDSEKDRDGEGEGEETCPVCFDEIGVDYVMTVCGHKYCEECIEKSLKRSPQCPSCRRNIDRKNLYYINDRKRKEVKKGTTSGQDCDIVNISSNDTVIIGNSMKKWVKRDGDIIMENELLKYNFFNNDCKSPVTHFGGGSGGGGKIYLYNTKFTDDLLLKDICNHLGTNRIIKVVKERM